MKMLFVVSIGVFLTAGAFAKHQTCRPENQIETAMVLLQKEFDTEFKFNSANQIAESIEKLISLSIQVNGRHITASGYTGECNGGAIWSRSEIKTSNKILKNGLCEVISSKTSSMCED